MKKIFWMMACVLCIGAGSVQAQGSRHWNRDESLTLNSGTEYATNTVALPTKFSVLDKLVLNNTSGFTTTVSVAVYETAWDTTSEDIGTFTVYPNSTQVFRPRPYSVSTETHYVATNNVIATLTVPVTNYLGSYTATKLRVIYNTPETNLTVRTTNFRPYVFAD